MSVFNRRSVGVVGVICGGVAGSASADVLYSNFGTGDTHSTTHGWTLSYGGPLGGDAFEDAAVFTVSGGDFYFNSAEVVINHFWGPDIVHFNLHADAGGAPGAVLDSTSASGLVEGGSAHLTADFGGDFLLEEGQSYWLALHTEETDAWLSWAHNSVDDFGLRAFQLNNGAWQPHFGIPGTNSERGVFRINGTLVPAPGALALLAIGGPVAARRRRA